MNNVDADFLEVVMVRREGRKLQSTMHNTDHPLNGVFSELKSAPLVADT